MKDNSKIIKKAERGKVRGRIKGKRGERKEG